jgi:hypothetical protein
MRNQNPALSTAAFLAAVLAASSAEAQTVTPTQDLSFGAFAAGAGGAVTISPQSARTATGDVTLMTGGQFSQGSSASFDVSGTANATYQITLPADGQVTLTGSQGGSMSVSSFTSSPSDEGQLSSLGTQTLYVGATLGVGSDQAPGTYSGSLNVTLVFQ